MPRKNKDIVSRLSFSEDDPVYSELAKFTSDKTIRQHLQFLIRKGLEKNQQELVFSPTGALVVQSNQPATTSGSSPSCPNMQVMASDTTVDKALAPDLSRAIDQIDTSTLDFLDSAPWPNSQ